MITVNVIGFALAMLVTQKIKGSNLLRGIFFMPNLIGGILLGFTWQFIFVQVFEAIGEKLQIGWLQGWLTNQKNRIYRIINCCDMAVIRIYDDDLYSSDPRIYQIQF